MTAMRILSLACHEGNPGRHFHLLQRERLARETGWPKLYTMPYRGGLTSEAVAEFACQAVMTGDQQAAAEAGGERGVPPVFPGGYRTGTARSQAAGDAAHQVTLI